MLAIKLQRIGKKHQPSYRLVVAEKKSKMAAPPVEDLGSYSSFTKAATLKKDRIEYWIKMGAQPTVTVHNLLVREKIVSTPTIKVKMSARGGSPPGADGPQAHASDGKAKPAEPVVVEAPAVAPAPAPEAAAPEAPQAEQPQEATQ